MSREADIRALFEQALQQSTIGTEERAALKLRLQDLLSSEIRVEPVPVDTWVLNGHEVRAIPGISLNCYEWIEFHQNHQVSIEEDAWPCSSNLVDTRIVMNNGKVEVWVILPDWAERWQLKPGYRRRK